MALPRSGPCRFDQARWRVSRVGTRSQKPETRNVVTAAVPSPAFYTLAAEWTIYPERCRTEICIDEAGQACFDKMTGASCFCVRLSIEEMLFTPDR